MQFNILIQSAPKDVNSTIQAIEFAKSALSNGHEITHVFFHGQGVEQLQTMKDAQADEFCAAELWQNFADESGVILRLCISSAQRRNITGHAHSVQIVGLGQFLDALLATDRTVTF